MKLELIKGDRFGELLVVDKVPRTLTALAGEITYLGVVSKALYLQIMQEHHLTQRRWL
jgi:hypothetical protein